MEDEEHESQHVIQYFEASYEGQQDEGFVQSCSLVVGSLTV